MGPDRNSLLRRYSVAGFAASLVTLAILFVMTELTSPIGGDPVVTQMLLELELQRNEPADSGGGVRVFKLPPTLQPQSTPDERVEKPERPKRPEQANVDEDPVEAERSRTIDWWAVAREVIKASGEAEFENWLEQQGYRKYVSIMQGPMPGADRETAPSALESTGSVYTNVYGDVEVPINENCVMQIRPGNFDSSDFAQNIPPQIVCKTSPESRLSGLEEFLDRQE